jgi:hypothetical protein
VVEHFLQDFETPLCLVGLYGNYFEGGLIGHRMSREIAEISDGIHGLPERRGDCFGGVLLS